MKELTGLIPTRNCIENDYCFIECIHSLLPLCHEVVVHDKGSTDGTLEALKEWAARDSRIRVIEASWQNPRGEKGWFTGWLNEARSFVRTPMMIQLDADEILGEDYATHSIIRTCVEKRDAIAVDRLNFVRDPRSLIPQGECCGKYVTRVGPSHLHWVSDEHYPRGVIPLLDMAHIEPMAKIYHLGFMRRPEAFYRKARVVLGAFFDNYDPRLANSEATGAHPFAEFPWFNRLDRYDGDHPKMVKEWLRSRGYAI
jgi:glycosyltransferase involved in cell wall biosynthesis